MVTYLCCSYSCRRELLLGLWHHSLSLFLVRLGCPTPLSHSTSNHCVALCTHPVFRGYLACVFKLFLFLWTICTTGARIMFILIFMVYPPWGKKSINIYWLINHQSPLFRSYFWILIGLKKKKKKRVKDQYSIDANTTMGSRGWACSSYPYGHFECSL